MAAWLLSTAAITSSLMLAVLAMRRQARRWLGAQGAYLLWALPLLRTVMPPLPAGFAPAAGSFGALSATARSWSAGVPSTAPDAVSWFGLAVPFAWLAGTALFLFVQAVRYRSFLARHLPGRTTRRRCGGIVLGMAEVDGPLAGGIIDRFVLLPLDFARRYSPGQRGLVLRHEVAHHRRGDIMANAAAILVLALHWWNPIAHLAYRAFRQDQELACDAEVLAGRSPAQRRAYADALVAAAGLPPRPVCGLSSRDWLAERLCGIAGLKVGTQRNSAWPAVATIVAGLLLSASAVPMREAGVRAVQQVRHQFAGVIAPTEVQASVEPSTPQRMARPRQIDPGSLLPTVPATPASASDVSSQGETVVTTSPCPPDGLPGNDCERERSRLLQLALVRDRVAADETLLPEQRAQMLRDIDEEVAHPRQQPIRG